MFFAAKILIICEISKTRERKKRLRGTGLERGNTGEGLEMP